jgi:alanyl aminopeptidase
MTRHRWLIVLMAVLFFGAAPAAEEDPPFRLPENVIPEAYRLDLTVVPDQAQFSGKVEIDVIITEPLDEIWLHGRGLDMKKIRIVPRDGKEVRARYLQMTPDGMSRVTPAKPLDPQRVTLRFEYRANFGDSLNGLYKVSVGDDDYAFSQLESIAARKVFPSFDEPEFKTPFDITVRTRRKYQAFSNTRALETIDRRRGMREIRFATTQPLPTYLIAFAVGPLDVVEWEPVPPSPVRDEPLPLRGIAVRGQGERLSFALENTAKILVDLEDYFGSPYPFDKLDIVAVPDFAAGAMENAGLITYREPLVLFGEQPAVNQVRRYAMVHTHELAHQWFGNLVTMPWWDDIWLNEAFASWIQAKVAHQWNPDFQFDRETQVRAIHAMREDSLVSARQIREPVESTADIKNAFDTITYQKGAGVLQMLEQYLGADIFRAGLREHMRRHAFGTATVYDLMDSLQQAAGDEFLVEAVFNSFLFQPGVPYLTVEKDCQDRMPRVRISQARFLPAGSAGDPDRTWRVPVCFVYGAPSSGDVERKRKCVVLSDRMQSFPIVGEKRCPAWIMPNAGGDGYYRWRMEPDEIAALAEAWPLLTDAGERLSFVDNLIAGVLSDSFPVSVLFDYMPMIAADHDRHVVVEPLATYRSLVNNVIEDAQRPAAIKFATDLYLPRLKALDRVESDLTEPEVYPDDALLRYRLMRFLAVDLGEPELRRELAQSAHRFLGYGKDAEPDPVALDPDLLRPALIVAAQDGDAEFIDFLIGSFEVSQDSRFRQAVMEALAFAADSDRLEKISDFALGEGVRGNELDTWLDWLLNPGVRPVTWPWVQDHLDAILAIGAERVGRDAPYTFGQWMCSVDDARALDTLFADRLDEYPGSRRNLARALERIDLCVAFQGAHSTAANARFEIAPTAGGGPE